MAFPGGTTNSPSGDAHGVYMHAAEQQRALYAAIAQIRTSD
jgi:hypothetical protein